jgi:2-iminoacetate synthase
MTDRELAQLICAFRITFPEVGIVLSTRERAALRDALAPLGVTMMSAGSHTEPGGYTRQGADDLHRTVRGRIVAPEFENGEDMLATGQFEISDGRSPAEVATALRLRGFEPDRAQYGCASPARVARAQPRGRRSHRVRAGGGGRVSPER